MSGLNWETAYSVVRIRSTFIREDKTDFETIGTAFFMQGKSSANIILVTNRHNVDPDIKFPNLNYSLKSVEIEHRECPTNDASDLTDRTTFFALSRLEDFKFDSSNMDLAIYIDPIFKNVVQNFKKCAFITLKDIATESDFRKDVTFMDTTSFIGFPKDWYDDSANLPIARLASIASLPHKYFKNKYLAGDVLIVSGLSFGGSSGSPLFSHAKGMKLEGAVTFDNYFAPKLIGVMSGHLVDERQTHSGLSYAIKSTSLLKLLKEHGIS